MVANLALLIKASILQNFTTHLQLSSWLAQKTPIPIPWKCFPHLHLSAALVATTMAVVTPPLLLHEHYFQLPSYASFLLFVHPAGTALQHTTFASQDYLVWPVLLLQMPATLPSSSLTCYPELYIDTSTTLATNCLHWQVHNMKTCNTQVQLVTQCCICSICSPTIRFSLCHSNSNMSS